MKKQSTLQSAQQTTIYAFLSVCLLLTAGFAPDLSAGEARYQCSDGIDNDSDGLTDGDDPDCGGGSEPGVTLAAKIAQLEAMIVSLQSENAAQQTTIDSLLAQAHSRYEDSEAISAVEPYHAPDLSNFVLNNMAALVEHDDILQYISIQEGELNKVKGPHFIIEGVNVHVRSGSGNQFDGCGPDFPHARSAPEYCPSATGLGNLIVGYNDLKEAWQGSIEDCAADEDGSIWDPQRPDVEMCTKRDGMHNLVVGNYHNFRGGGNFLSGMANDADGSFGTIAGGFYNTTWGNTTIVGGTEGRAIGAASVIVGGQRNVANGYFATVFGGRDNVVGELPATWTSQPYLQRNDWPVSDADPYSAILGGQDRETTSSGCILGDSTDTC